jgi:hypothetical protein
LFITLDFGVGKEIVRLGVEEDRVVTDPVFYERSFELRPDRPMPTLVFGFASAAYPHPKGFANHAVILRETGLGR